MQSEAKAVVDAIRAYNAAHQGDSDDAEIDAAIEMADAALALVRRMAGDDPEVASLISEIDARKES